MIAGPLATPELLTVRGLRRDSACAPGSERFAEVVRWHLPLVYGAALALIPENAAAADAVSVAAFQALAYRWRKLSRRTVMATWLLRTVWFAAVRERRRLGLRRKPATARDVIAYGLLKQINGLKARHSNAFVLATLLGEPIETVATALRSKPNRVQRRVAKATRKLDKRLRKLAATAAKRFSAERLLDAASTPAADCKLGGALAALRTIVGPVPPDVEVMVLSRIAEWQRQAPMGEVVRAAISAWRWRAVRLLLRRLGVAMGVMVLLAAAGFGSFVYLWEQGYLHLAFIQWSQFKMIRRFPEMAKPAQPWPANARVASVPPANAAELYGLTNIWPAKIRMTRDQWRAAQPKYVRPLPKMWDGGQVKLRNPKASRNGFAGAIGLDLPWSDGSLEFAGQTFDRVGIRFRGNGSYVTSFQLEKHPYKVDLNRIQKGQRLAGITTLNFVNALVDFSYLHDALAQQLFRELGAVAPRTAYAYLTVDVPGKFANLPLGLYVLIEDIDSNFAKDRFGSKSAPVFKPVTYDLFGDWGADWSAYKEVYDLKTKATAEQLARVIDLAKLVTHADDEEFARKLPEFLDLEEYAAFVAGHVLLSTYDGYFTDGQNFYLYLDPRSNRFGFIPWDQDVAFGGFAWLGTTEKRENASIWKPATYNNRFLYRVMKVKAFRNIYRHKLEEALAGPFTVERLNREIDRVAAVIRPAIAAESQFRLQKFELTISTNWFKGPRNGTRKNNSVFGPAAPPQELKRFIQARVRSVRNQLDGKSEGSRVPGFAEGN